MGFSAWGPSPYPVKVRLGPESPSPCSTGGNLVLSLSKFLFLVGFLLWPSWPGAREGLLPDSLQC